MMKVGFCGYMSYICTLFFIWAVCPFLFVMLAMELCIIRKLVRRGSIFLYFCPLMLFCVMAAERFFPFLLAACSSFKSIPYWEVYSIRLSSIILLSSCSVLSKMEIQSDLHMGSKKLVKALVMLDTEIDPNWLNNRLQNCQAPNKFVS